MVTLKEAVQKGSVSHWEKIEKVESSKERDVQPTTLFHRQHITWMQRNRVTRMCPSAS